VLEGHTDSVWALTVLPDGRVVSGSDDKSVRVWDLAGGTPRVLEGHTDRVLALAALSDGRVVSGSSDNTVRVWSKTYQLLHMFVADAPIICLTTTLDGVMVAGCQDGTVQFLRLP
jgi:WD40 repeat protein